MLNFMEKTIKLHTPEVIEAFHAQFLPKLFLMEANMSMRFYLMKQTNVTMAKLIYEFLIGFHGNPTSLYYELDTCSQTF